MTDDPILNFFKKLPEVIPGITIRKEEKALLNSDLLPNDMVFSIIKFNEKTWENIEEGVKKMFDSTVDIQRTFPRVISPHDGGRGYIIRADPPWFVNFSCSSPYKGEEFQLYCSVRGSRIRPSQ